MERKFGSLKRALPIWLLVFTLIACAAGGAIGTVLSGKVTGDMPVTVSQALLVGKPEFVSTDTDWADNSGSVKGVTRQTFPLKHYQPDRFFSSVSDDQTAFTAAAEVDTGDVFLIRVPLKNASQEDMVVELTLIYPGGLTVECFASDEETSSSTNNTRNIVRTGLYTWKFHLKKEADKTPNKWDDAIGIAVAVSDTTSPGFYTIEGKFKQVGY